MIDLYDGNGSIDPSSMELLIEAVRSNGESSFVSFSESPSCTRPVRNPDVRIGSVLPDIPSDRANVASSNGRLHTPRVDRTGRRLSHSFPDRAGPADARGENRSQYRRTFFRRHYGNVNP